MERLSEIDQVIYERSDGSSRKWLIISAVVACYVAYARFSCEQQQNWVNEVLFFGTYPFRSTHIGTRRWILNIGWTFRCTASYIMAANKHTPALIYFCQIMRWLSYFSASEFAGQSGWAARGNDAGTDYLSTNTLAADFVRFHSLNFNSPPHAWARVRCTYLALFMDDSFCGQTIPQYVCVHANVCVCVSVFAEKNHNKNHFSVLEIQHK